MILDTVPDIHNCGRRYTVKAVKHKSRSGPGRSRHCDDPALRQRGGRHSAEAKRWKNFWRQEKKKQKKRKEWADAHAQEVAWMRGEFFYRG